MTDCGLSDRLRLWSVHNFFVICVLHPKKYFFCGNYSCNNNLSDMHKAIHDVLSLPLFRLTCSVTEPGRMWACMCDIITLKMTYIECRGKRLFSGSLNIINVTWKFPNVLSWVINVSKWINVKCGVLLSSMSRYRSGSLRFYSSNYHNPLWEKLNVWLN